MAAQGADNWADAPLIQIGETSAPTPSAGLTQESFEASLHSQTRTAWWKVVPGTDEPIVFDLSDSIIHGSTADADSVLLVYRARPGVPPPAQMLLAASSDDIDYDAGDYLSRATLKNPVPGETYWVCAALYGFSDDIDYVLKLTSVPTYYGGWLDDAGTQWLQTAGVSLDPHELSDRAVSYTTSGFYPGAGTEPEMGDLWNGVNGVTRDEQSPPEFRVVYNLGGGTDASWTQTWLTLVREGDGGGEVPSTQLPPGVLDSNGDFVDPNVISVEWEPATVPVRQRLRVGLVGEGDETILTGDRAMHIKLVSGVGGVYDPGFLTGPALAGIPDATSETLTATDRSVVIDDPPIPLDGDTAIAASLVDDFTQAQTYPSFYTGASGEHGIRVQAYYLLALEGEYRPRYRLRYMGEPPAVTVFGIPPLRQVQRGDGLGFSSAPRAIQNNSVQGSLRNFGFN